MPGQYQSVTFPNGQVRGYGYDVNNQTGQSTMLGQRTSLTATVPPQGLNNALSKYYYDPLYQLTRADYPSGPPFNGEVHQWTYDAIGNRLTNTVNSTTQTYAYFKNGANPLNGQRLSSDGVSAYSWDSNGSNLTRNGAPGNFTFSYDVDNRLASITGAATASYTYDYQGRRTAKTVSGVTTTYLYDGLNLVRETVAGTSADYAFGPGIDEPLAQYRSGTLSYFAADGLGTVAVTSSPSGTASLSTTFDAWGSTKSETGTRTQPFTYTGREVGEAGMLFYRARFLQTAVGRFTQEDPIRSPASPYAYAHNRPEVFADPSGMKCCVRRVTVQLFPSAPVRGGAAGATVGAWICGEVSNPEDCKITQRAMNLGSYNPRDGWTGGGGWYDDSPESSHVFRLPGKICMWDNPGWPLDKIKGASGSGPTTTMYSGAPGFPFYDAAFFETTVRDRHDTSDSKSATWGYAIACQSPGQCAFWLSGN